jgi:hypothetical protein
MSAKRRPTADPLPPVDPNNLYGRIEAQGRMPFPYPETEGGLVDHWKAHYGELAAALSDDDLAAGWEDALAETRTEPGRSRDYGQGGGLAALEARYARLTGQVEAYGSELGRRAGVGTAGVQR